ncbi:YgaP family membrane protein [Bacillus sp. V3-13]|uniref:YgaP family membrane protein n=1 Tax=Bacillus sp. V3-13 TaxID=2053728 RepID=UPI00215209F6|nr:DUF2892 domain-containing protein [Bacillus sp. V3-13]
MKITPNIGIINALIRITVGLTVLSWSTAKLVKKPRRDSYLVMAMLGAMKVAEGIVRYCPVTALFETGQHNMQNRESQSQPNMKENGHNQAKQAVTQNSGNNSKQDEKHAGEKQPKQEKSESGDDIKTEIINQLLGDNPLK